MPVDAWAAIAEKIRPLQPCAVHHQTVVIPVDIPSRWEPRAKQSRTVALLTALCAALRVAFADFSSAPWRGLEKSERCPNNSSLFRPQAAVVVVAVRVLYRPPQKNPQTEWSASFLVDIPSRWEPRAKQQPTGLIAYSADWRRQSRPVRALYRPPQKNPQTKWSGDCGGALSTALEPNTSSREMVLESSVKLKLSTTRSSKT